MEHGREANDGKAESQGHANPGGGEGELQECELSFPALEKCGDEQAETLMTPLLSCDSNHQFQNPGSTHDTVPFHCQDVKECAVRNM